MKVYLNDDKTYVVLQPYNDILWGLKAHFDSRLVHKNVFSRAKVSHISASTINKFKNHADLAFLS